MIAVIFTARLREPDPPGYALAAQQMRALAEQVPGFIAIQSLQVGVDETTISYWMSEEAITTWREHPDHRSTQERGRREWYEHYEVRVARVERTYGWPPPEG